VRREEYGVFVELEAMGSKWGLVHFSQIKKADGSKVEVMEEVEEHQEVYVKVLSVDVEAEKVGLSMKHVDQQSGEDLDPFQVKMQQDKEEEERRKKGRDRDFGGRREEEDLRNYSYGKAKGGGPPGEEEEEEEDGPKQEKNFGLSGLLAKETRTFQGVELKFTEPPEARAPTQKWRLYEFKGDEQLRVLHLHRSSCFLFGRDRAHLMKFPGFIPTDHPSCSSQHAVIQFRNHQEDDNMGGVIQKVKPYLMDLCATNGTFLNGEKIEDMRYYELKEKDLVRFGNSSREYVLLHVPDEK